MAMFRNEKMAELLRHEVSEVLLKEVDFPAGSLVTVTRVKVSHDLANASIFLGVLPDSKVKEVLEILKKNIYHIQKIIDKKLKIRPVPKISFKDDSEEREMAKVNDILYKIGEEKK
jgi:ribosome-binding factor A